MARWLRFGSQNEYLGQYEGQRVPSSLPGDTWMLATPIRMFELSLARLERTAAWEVAPLSPHKLKYDQVADRIRVIKGA